MQVITDLKENRSHTLSTADASEWWYFDGNDDSNEYSFAIVFLTENPFPTCPISKEKPNLENEKTTGICILSFNLYYEGRLIYKIFNELPRNKFSSEELNENERLFFDKSSFFFDRKENQYRLSINILPSAIQDKFKAEFIFSVKSDIKEIKINHRTNKFCHYWLPAAGVCEMSGKFKFYKDFKRRKTEFEGYGYHDHHWSSDSLFENIREWYKGKVITKDYSIVYFFVSYHDNLIPPVKKILLFNKGKLIQEIEEFEVKLNNPNNYWLLKNNSGLSIDCGNIRLCVKNENKVENSLFCTRALSLYDLFIDGTNVIKGARGFSEYLNRERNGKSFFKPFKKAMPKQTD